MDNRKIKLSFHLDALDDAIARWHKHKLERRDAFPLNLSIKVELNKDTSAKVVEQIVEHQKTFLGKERVSRISILRALKVLSGNYLVKNHDYLAYSRLPNYYTKNHYNAGGVGYKILMDLIRSLIELGFITSHFKALKSAAKDRQTSRFKFSKKYRKLLLPSTRCEFLRFIYVKDDDGKLCEFENHRGKVIHLVKKLTVINEIIGNAKYTFRDQLIEAPVLKRVFNKKSLRKGGRFYVQGGINFQNMKKEQRIQIKINGESTVELDFKSIHPHILYSIKDVQLKGDPYELEGHTRDLIKSIFLITLNSKSQRSATQAISKEHKIPYSKSREIISLLLKKHHIISDLFFSKNIALKLQFIDSQIAETILLNFIKKTNSPILPIHDSFLIQKQYSLILKKIMLSTYTQFTKYNISI